MFPSQTFQPSDLAGVGVLIVLEALLSADNALVLAIMVRHLPRKDQQKALLYGLGGAFVFRLIAILFASIVLKQWWLQGIGAIYLLYLPIKHFLTRSKDAEVKPIGLSFWRTVVAVEMTDIAFALDSVLAGIGFISRPGKGIQTDKIWVVYIGAVLGIILLRFAASMFIRLLERFPILDHVAYVLVGWVGVKLIFHSGSKYQEAYPNSLPFHVWHLPESVFWIGLGLIAVGGAILAYLKQRPEETTWDDEAQVVGEAQDWRITEEESSRTQ
ncbi:MAG TPA: TerC family protein [Fimbriimonadaceae bacterium]|nr:TerC family protein [Fimbriimonadaceae bacterium]